MESPETLEKGTQNEMMAWVLDWECRECKSSATNIPADFISWVAAGAAAVAHHREHFPGCAIFQEGERKYTVNSVSSNGRHVVTIEPKEPGK